MSSNSNRVNMNMKNTMMRRVRVTKKKIKEYKMSSLSRKEPPVMQTRNLTIHGQAAQITRRKRSLTIIQMCSLLVRYLINLKAKGHIIDNQVLQLECLPEVLL